MPDDLYDALGVAKDASADEIKAAGRRAAKRTHPDTPGGSAEAFHTVGNALAILRDPTKRARYDETGDGTQRISGAVDARARVTLAAHFQNLAARTDIDFEYTDLVSAIQAALMADVEAHRGVIREVKERIVRLGQIKARMKKRSGKGPNVLVELMNNQIRGMQEQIGQAGENLAIVEHAIELAAEYEYRVDAQPVYSPGPSVYVNMNQIFRGGV